ncbi:MAG: dockerin type I repeat-containing protein [Muribaculaceae bacterium]|nr:dockerin type I repeat-containing protein [Muribaculaceae bacterium]
MRKLFILTAIAGLTLTAQAQLRSEFTKHSNVAPQEGVIVPDATPARAGAMPKNMKRAEGDALKAIYRRPAGVFYNALYTRDSKPGSIYGYNAPQLHATGYVPMTYTSMTDGADTYFWSGLHTVGWSKEEVTSTEREFTIIHPVVMADSVPTLTVTAGNATASYFLCGYDATPELKKSTVWTYPCWQYGSSSTMQERHAWESSKYIALRHARFDSEASASSYYTMDSQWAAPEAEKAYFLGRNTRGYDVAGIAFERPAYPYLINHVGVRYQGLKWTEAAASTGVATITAAIYELDEIPAYSDTQSVTPSVGRLIASGSATLNASLSAEKDILSIPVLDSNSAVPEITGNILVLVTGYNDDDIAEITLTVSNDNEDEGYGELGYVGICDEDGYITAIKGLNNFLRQGIKSAPSIYIETERPWLTTNSGSEAAERNFDAAGETYTVELFAYKPMSMWSEKEVDADGNVVGNVPAWVGLSMEQTNSWDQGCSVNATFAVKPLPAGTEYREAIIRFAYSGALFYYKVTQGTLQVGDITGDGTVDVSDVNAAINIILKEKTAEDYPGNADLTGDGTVDVSDVNAAINIILKAN